MDHLPLAMVIKGKYDHRLLSKIPSLQEVPIWEENFFLPSSFSLLVIAFRKDVIIQVLIGAHCSNPF